MKVIKKSKKKIIIAVFLVLLIPVAINYCIFVSDYYHASENAMNYIEHPADGVKVRYEGRNIIYEPKDPKAGFIFYPGGLVETEAYAPIMEQLAENGIQVIEIGMPNYLAFLDANGARGVIDKYPEIDDWYIGGHSLGGAMSALYADIHSDEYEGLILMASFSVSDLKETDLRVLSLRGSEDGVLNQEKFDKYLKNYPTTFEDVIIPGGCHSYFGDYGLQDGDGEPTITVSEQTSITVEEILKFIK